MGKGYGEEVDWSQKAAAQGWRHIAVPGVFVEHIGSQSFSESKKAAMDGALKKLSVSYPDFDATVQDFIRRDPLAGFRRRVDISRLKQISTRYILFVSHYLGGGIQRHIHDLAHYLSLEGVTALLMQPIDSSSWVQISCTDNSTQIGLKYDLDQTSEFQTLIEDLNAVDIQHIHFHSTIGYRQSDLIWSLPEHINRPYDITIHDYQAICPRLNLIDQTGRYCGEPDVEQCDRCIQTNGTYSDASVSKMYARLGTTHAWREYFQKRLQQARTVFCPSKDTKTRMSKYSSAENLRFEYHPEAVEKSTKFTLGSQKKEGAISVAIIGAISDIKGFSIIQEVAIAAKRKQRLIEFFVFGFTENDSIFESIDNVRILGAYSTYSELQSMLEQYPCDVAAFFSLWPETYSYTLSEAISLGMSPVVFDIGAFPERVAGIETAKVLNMNDSIETILDALLSSGKQTRRTQTVIDASSFQKPDSILENYYQIHLP